MWGGSKLGDILGKPVASDNIGESWEISSVPENVSVVSNGSLKGKNLQELIDTYGPALLGPEIQKEFDGEFPILIKFIDAEKDLSIQLHPGDELARKRHQSSGKTEMWYIMEAEPGAELIIGFNREISPEEYVQSLQQNRLLELLNYVPVDKGDTFFINSGKVHAIGAGILLAEIQQTSDVTYRIFDFNRRDKDGALRELHTEQALEAIDYSKKEDYRISYKQNKGELNEMVSSPYFKTSYLSIDKPLVLNLADRSSFTIYICVKGEVSIDDSSHRENLKMGETILIPACISEIKLESEDCVLLEVKI